MLSEEDIRYKEPEWIYWLTDKIRGDTEAADKIRAFFIGFGVFAMLTMMIHKPEEGEPMRGDDLWLALPIVLALVGGFLANSIAAWDASKGWFFNQQNTIFRRWLEARAVADAWSIDWTEEQIEGLQFHLDWMERVRLHFQEEDKKRIRRSAKVEYLERLLSCIRQKQSVQAEREEDREDQGGD